MRNDVIKMKKTIFGAILATFLVMSVGFIAPIQVQAVETEVDRVKENIGVLATKLSSDSDFKKLLDLDDEDNEGLYSIVQQVLESGSTQQLANEYKNIIEGMDAFKNLKAKDYKQQIASIQNDMESILSNSETKEGKEVYYVGVENNDLSISEKREYNHIEIDKQGNIQIPGYSSMDPSATQNIKDFLIMLFMACVGVAIGVAVIAGVIFLIQAILTAIAGGLGTLLTAVIGLAIVFVGIAGISMVATFIIDVIEFLTNTGDESEAISKNTTRLVKLSNKVKSFMNRLLVLFSMRFHNSLA